MLWPVRKHTQNLSGHQPTCHDPTPHSPFNDVMIVHDRALRWALRPTLKLPCSLSAARHSITDAASVPLPRPRMLSSFINCFTTRLASVLHNQCKFKRERIANAKQHPRISIHNPDTQPVADSVTVACRGTIHCSPPAIYSCEPQRKHFTFCRSVIRCCRPGRKGVS